MGLFSKLKNAFREAEIGRQEKADNDIVIAERASIKFNVAGVTKDGRQDLLRDRSIFEPSGTEKELSLELDNGNKHDPSAVKVIHHRAGLIGFVPKETTQRVRNFLKSHDLYAIKYESSEFTPTDKSGTKLIAVTVRLYAASSSREAER